MTCLIRSSGAVGEGLTLTAVVAVQVLVVIAKL